MWQMTNLPTKHSKVEIQATVEENGNIRIHTSEGWAICTVSQCTQEGLAQDIADAIRMARDRGFEQGRAYVRDALGL